MPIKLSPILNGFLLYFCFYCSCFSQIIDYHTKIELDYDEKITTKIVTIQVNNIDQRSRGEIEIPHDNNLKILYAEITDLDGKVLQKLKKKDILTRTAFSQITFHQDQKISEFDLYWNNYPYQIRYAYKTYQKNFFYLANWYPKIFNQKTPKNCSVELVINSNNKIKFKNSVEFKFKETSLGDKKTLKWVLPQTKIEESQIFGQDPMNKIPHVKAYKESFKYGVEGNLKSWQNYGDWFLKLNENKTTLTNKEQLIVDSILSETTSKKEKIKRLYNYLQDQTTYVNVNIDFGGLESYPASYVCENKYGDCKALTTYMMGLLKYAKIPSYYTLVDSGNDLYNSNGWIDETSPGPQFNHIILGVPVEKDTIWLENTSSSAPFDYTGTFIQNRKALWIEKNKSKLVKLPEISPKVNHNLSERKYTLDEFGNGEVSIDLLCRGKNFERLKSLNENEKEDAISKLLKQNFNSKFFTLKNWNIELEDRNSKSLTLQIDGTIKKILRKVGSLTVIETPKIEIPKVQKPVNRNTAIHIKTPINNTEINYFKFNKIDHVDKSYDSIETKYGSYSYLISKENDVVKFEENFTLYSGDYDLNQYPDFYKFLNTSRLKQKKAVIILNNI